LVISVDDDDEDDEDEEDDGVEEDEATDDEPAMLSHFLMVLLTLFSCFVRSKSD
jgi:hypothetical protein